MTDSKIEEILSKFPDGDEASLLGYFDDYVQTDPDAAFGDFASYCAEIGDVGLFVSRLNTRSHPHDVGAAAMALWGQWREHWIDELEAQQQEAWKLVQQRDRLIFGEAA